jgi:putative heme-binding domain-containing protein
MISGTGEAPCEIVAYESDGLPDTYRGQLLVASWADHQIERFQLSYDPQHALVRTQRATFVSGNNEFRPVGIAVAPDGSLYISDWVSSSYALHRLGRIWHVTNKSQTERSKTTTPAERLLARDRRVREAAARKLAGTQSGRSVLESRLQHGDSRVRSAVLQALNTAPPPASILKELAARDPEIAVRALALNLLLDTGGDPLPWWSPSIPTTLRAIAAAHFDPVSHREPLLAALRHPDPLVLHAAVQQLASAGDRNPKFLRAYREQRPLGSLLAMRRSQQHAAFAESQLKTFLSHSDPRVRFHAIKWIADDQLSQFRPDLLKLLDDKRTRSGTFRALVTAIDRLDGRKPSDRPAADFLAQRVLAEQAPPEVRQVSLQLLDPASRKLSLEQLSALLRENFEPLRLTAVQYLCHHHQPERFAILLDLARDTQQSTEVRATAVSGLAPHAEALVDDLLALCQQSLAEIRLEAARSLIGVKPARIPHDKLKRLDPAPGWQQAVQRLTAGTPGPRPAATEIDAWLDLLPATGDPAAGERIFMNRKVGTCGGCHRMRGRGRAVGPDLTAINQRLRSSGVDTRRWLLRSLLQPGRDMAPQYTPWIIVTKAGKTVTGLPRRKGGSGEAYLGIDGKEFTLKKSQIAFHRESDTSLMPAQLLDALTTTEISDLLAFLTSANGDGAR